MKFICDTMLGKLAKYLRIMGFDASYSNSFSWHQIVSSATAEQRIILTRRTDLLLPEQRPACYVIQGNYPYEQLQDVLRHFELQTDSSGFFTRCLLCNKLLTSVEKASVAGNIPDYVFSTVNDFSQCPCCRKIYWKGTHHYNMMRRLSLLLQPAH
jgi:uncharacterized protein with PIN domain